MRHVDAGSIFLMVEGEWNETVAGFIDYRLRLSESGNYCCHGHWHDWFHMFYIQKVA
jgi:hypothetical protein